MQLKFVISAIALMITSTSFPAQAQVANHIKLCEAPDAAVDDLIKHCTVAIRSNKLTPDQEARAFVNRATAFFAREQYSLALRDNNLALERSPNLVVEYERAARLDPNDSQSYLGAGSALVALGRHGEAVLAYDNAVALDPKNANALFNRAVARTKSGDPSGAVGDLTQVISIDPSDAEAFVARGRAHAEGGNLQAAYNDYTSAIETDAGYAYAYFIRGRMLLDNGQSSPADADFSDAYKLGLDDPWLAQYVAGQGKN